MLPLHKLLFNTLLALPLLAAAEGLIWQKSVHGFDYYRGQLSVHGNTCAALMMKFWVTTSVLWSINLKRNCCRATTAICV